MDRKIIVTGGSGSGKDYLCKLFINENYQVGVKTTTRPKRNNEIEGKDYYYVNIDTFDRIKSFNDFILAESFNIINVDNNNETWFYGLELNEFRRADVLILTPGEIKELCDNGMRENMLIFYLDIDKDIRRERILKRKDNNDNIERRLSSDDKDFNEFNLYDFKITDPDFNLDSIIKYIKKEI